MAGKAGFPTRVYENCTKILSAALSKVRSLLTPEPKREQVMKNQVLMR